MCDNQGSGQRKAKTKKNTQHQQQNKPAIQIDNNHNANHSPLRLMVVNYHFFKHQIIKNTFRDLSENVPVDSLFIFLKKNFVFFK